MSNFYFWLILLVIFPLSLIVRFFYVRQILSKIKNDELLPRVKEMLSGNITRSLIIKTKDSLQREGLDEKRIKRLVVAVISSKGSKYTKLFYGALLIILVVNVVRYSSFVVPVNSIRNSNTAGVVATPIGPAVYTNTEQGYEIVLPTGWAGVTYNQAPGKLYFINLESGNNKTASYPTEFEVIPVKTQKDISTPSGQQNVLLSMDTKLRSDSAISITADNLSSSTPYIEYTGIKDTTTYRSRWYYFFGGGRMYALLISSPDALWPSVISELTQMIPTFKVL